MFHTAAIAGNVHAVGVLCALGCDREAKANGSTALVLAVAFRQVPVVRLLLDLNASTANHRWNWPVSYVAEMQDIVSNHGRRSVRKKERRRL